MAVNSIMSDSLYLFSCGNCIPIREKLGNLEKGCLATMSSSDTKYY